MKRASGQQEPNKSECNVVQKIINNKTVLVCTNQEPHQCFFDSSSRKVTMKTPHSDDGVSFAHAESLGIRKSSNNLFGFNCAEVCQSMQTYVKSNSVWLLKQLASLVVAGILVGLSLGMHYNTNYTYDHTLTINL